MAQIDVMDFDRIGAHGLIGRTVIDLEDRWFDQRWQVPAGDRTVSCLEPERQRSLGNSVAVWRVLRDAHELS